MGGMSSRGGRLYPVSDLGRIRMGERLFQGMANEAFVAHMHGLLRLLSEATI